jgi:putative transposase
MPKGLRRFHASGQRHFITCSCYHRLPFLGSARRRDLFLTILDQVSQARTGGIAGVLALEQLP